MQFSGHLCVADVEEECQRNNCNGRKAEEKHQAAKRLSMMKDCLTIENSIYHH